MTICQMLVLTMAVNGFTRFVENLALASLSFPNVWKLMTASATFGNGSTLNPKTLNPKTLKP